MNKVGGIFAYIFWVALGFVLGVIVSLKFLCEIW